MLVNQLFMAIFNSYVSLPKGSPKYPGLSLVYINMN